jgi:hypothetical protein
MALIWFKHQEAIGLAACYSSLAQRMIYHGQSEALLVALGAIEDEARSERSAARK